MVGYYALTTAYSLYLKRRIVADICVLAGLYTLRIVAGGAATGIPLSVWLLAFSIFFFLSLAAVKRQAELVDNAKQGKLEASGRGYHVDDLPIISNDLDQRRLCRGSGYGPICELTLRGRPLRTPRGALGCLRGVAVLDYPNGCHRAPRWNA